MHSFLERKPPDIHRSSSLFRDFSQVKRVAAQLPNGIDEGLYPLFLLIPFDALEQRFVFFRKRRRLFHLYFLLVFQNRNYSAYKYTIMLPVCQEK